jgi:potassium-dependent mechanosensitive channel
VALNIQVAGTALAQTSTVTEAPVQPPPEAAFGDLPTPVTEVIDYLTNLLDRMASQLFSASAAIQVATILVAAAIAWALSRPAHAAVSRAWPDRLVSQETRGFRVLHNLVFPALWALILWIGVIALRRMELGNDGVRIVGNLIAAWLVISIFSAFVSDPFWSKSFAVVAWAVAALNILTLLGPTIDLLDRAAITFGATRLSLYTVLKGLVLVAILLWFASVVATAINVRIQRTSRLTPSVRGLIGQGVRLGLLFLAVAIALNAIGVDLTALAVFSGAIGIGIGFGLQSIFSNLVAGIIMLFERSVKVGDFVEIEGGITGEVREINIRSTLITTNDNIDISVPNSEFVNNRVTNWTLRDALRRVRIPFGVAYGTDKELVRKAGLEAAADSPHTLHGLAGRDPQVWLVGFGGSSLDFELVVWLTAEAVKRPAKVHADYNWAIETALKKYGIEIPFPQRDLHIRSGKLPVLLDDKQSDAK